MSASTRDQRATIYPYVGYNEGGFATAAYGTARGTYWSRFSPAPGSESILDAQAGVLARATIEFADEVPVAENDLIVIDDVQWKAGPITERKAQRALILQVERSNEMATLPTGVTAPATPDDVVDGGHSDEDFVAPDDTNADGGDASSTSWDDTLDGGGA